MSGAGAKQTSPGDKPRRSLSGQGGLLQRMFGSSNASKEALDTSPSVESHPATEVPASPVITNTAGGNSNSNSNSNSNNGGSGSIDTIDENTEDESRDEVSAELRSPARRSPDDSGDKKRRTSGVGKLFSSAKQSLSNLGGTPDQKPTNVGPQTPMQKLAKSDPALSVPQGTLNNSAGESAPGPRSTFRVGVTEDKNKKCRRTMEDTHAYLYNFLSTPSPFAAPDQPSIKKRYSLSLTQTLSRESTRDSTMSELASLSPKQSATKEVIETDNGYFAIFDGHAGTFAADWCGKKVHILLEEHIRRNPNTPIPEVLDMTFTTVDQQLEKLPLKNSGCTAVIAVLRWEDRIPNNQSATGSTAIAPAAAAAVAAKNDDSSNQSDGVITPGLESKLKDFASRQRVLYTANVGDARVVLCRNGKALRLSYDHKGSDENEGKRIAGAGGLILNNRVNGVLAVTRALGDAYMKDLVTGHPYTTETVIQPEMDEFLILACDGLWDVCSDQEAVDLVREVQDPQTASKMLVDHALARFSTDNLSCMVVRFHSQTAQQALDSSENLVGVETDASTKLGDISEVDAIVKDGERNAEHGGEGSALSRPSTEEMVEEVKNQDPGPELNPAALEAARKDKPAAPTTTSD